MHYIGHGESNNIVILLGPSGSMINGYSHVVWWGIRLFILTFLDIEIFFFEKIDIEIDLSRIIVNFDDSDVKL